MKSMMLAACAVLLLTASQQAVAEDGITRPDKPILFLVERGYNRGEFFHLWAPMRALDLPLVVASIEGGIIYQSPKAQPDRQQRDIPDSIAISAAGQATDYSALAIPGGYSPGFLEKDAGARAMAASFVANQQPVTAVCHGPRLLMSAGAIDGRVVAGLYTLPDELADLWLTDDKGVFVDRPLVIDNDLYTARYPGDMVQLSRTFIQRLTNGTGFIHGGPELLVLGAGLDGHRRWVLRETGAVLGYRPRLAQSAEELDRWMANDEFDLSGVVSVVVLPGGEGLLDHSALHQLPATANRVTVATTVDGLEQVGGELPTADLSQDMYTWLPAITQVARDGAAAHGLMPAAGARPPATAALVLRDGFDETVALPLRSALAAAGYGVVIVSDHGDYVRGQHGLPMAVDHTLAEARPWIADDAVVVLPGGVYPEANARARQADQPSWVTSELAARDAARKAWVLDHLDRGGRVLAVGLDSLRLGRGEARFAGQRFASTTQARWSFGKEGAGFIDATIHAANGQVLTADNQPATVHELVRQITAGEWPAAVE